MTATLAMMLSFTLVAQDRKERPSGLFGYGSTSASETSGLFTLNRNETEIDEVEIEFEDFGETVPIGNGLFLLFTTSVSYAMLKRKEEKR